MSTPITIHVTDVATGDPIEGATVSVWNNTFSTNYAEEPTDAGGDFTTALPSAAYSVFVLKEGFTFYPLPKIIGVGDVTDTYDIVGTAVASPALPSGYVWVHGTIKDITLNPLTNTPVNIYLTYTPQKNNAALLDRSIMTLHTDETGVWGSLLPGGAYVTVTIPAAKFSKSGQLPFAGSLEVNDLGVFG
jgi:hypothetical protein